MATEIQIERIKKLWEGYAKEAVNVVEIGGTFYGFCSELAALRIHYEYRHGSQEHTRVIYSTNLETWCFVLEPTEYMEANEASR